MIDLPYEIWLHIAEYLPDSGVCTLYSVNRALYDIALNLKYKNASIGVLPDRVIDETRPPILGNQDLSSRPTALEITFYDTPNRSGPNVVPVKFSLNTFISSAITGMMGYKPQEVSPAAKLAQILYAMAKFTRVTKLSFKSVNVLGRLPGIRVEAFLIFPKVLGFIGNNLRTLHIQSPFVVYLPPRLMSLESFSLDALSPYHTSGFHIIMLERVCAFLQAHTSTLRDVSFSIDNQTLDVLPIFQSLRLISCLHSLNLSLSNYVERNIHTALLKQVHEVLEIHQQHIQSLTLCCNRDIVGGWSSLLYPIDSFRQEWVSIKLPNLKNLTLRLPGMPYNVACIRPFTRSLISLKIMHIPFIPYAVDSELESFCETFNQFSRLQDLHLFIPELTVKHLVLFSRTLPDLRSLHIQCKTHTFGLETGMNPIVLSSWALESLDCECNSQRRTDRLDWELAGCLPKAMWINKRTRRECLFIPLNKLSKYGIVRHSDLDITSVKHGCIEYVSTCPGPKFALDSVGIALDYYLNELYKSPNLSNSWHVLHTCHCGMKMRNLTMLLTTKRPPSQGRVSIKIMDFPYEIWQKIVEHLPDHQVRRLYSVNRALYNIALDSRYKYALIGILPDRVMEETKPPIIRNGQLSSRPVALEVTLYDVPDRSGPNVMQIKFLSLFKTFLPTVINRTMGRKPKAIPATVRLAQILDIMPKFARVTSLRFTSVHGLDRFCDPEASLIFPELVGCIGNRLRALRIQSPFVAYLPPRIESLESFSLDALRPYHTVGFHLIMIQKIPVFVQAHISTLRDVSFSIDHTSVSPGTNNFGEEHMDISPVLQCLQLISCLHSLSLSLPYHTVENVTATLFKLVHEILETHQRHLESLALGYICDHRAGGWATRDNITAYFRHEWHLVKLPNLKNLTLCFPGMPYHVAYIRPFSCSLVSLKIMRFGIRPYPGTPELQFFCKTLSRFPCLQDLRLFVSEFNVKHLGFFARTLPHLRTLHLDCIRSPLEASLGTNLDRTLLSNWALESLDYKTPGWKRDHDWLDQRVAIELRNVLWINKKTRKECLSRPLNLLN